MLVGEAFLVRPIGSTGEKVDVECTRKLGIERYKKIQEVAGRLECK